MLSQISQHLKELLTSFPKEDQLLFNSRLLDLNPQNFQPLIPPTGPKTPETPKTLAFIDGGQAEILSAANFCLSFIRIVAQFFRHNQRTGHSQRAHQFKKEFYLLTTARYENNDLFYRSQIFGDQLLNQQDLFISSNHQTIRSGTERAPITKITSLARRFAELALAKELQADHIILDGTLTPTYQNEETYLKKLPPHVSALAKSSQLFTTFGNSPLVLLNQLGPPNCWSYHLEDQTYFVKLHPRSQHVFRFEGSPQVLPYLLSNSQDPLFLGYPYGLLLADKFARITHQEKSSLQTQFLLNRNNKDILEYLTTTNAHFILDNIS